MTSTNSTSQAFDPHFQYIIFEPSEDSKHLGIYIKTNTLTREDQLEQVVKQIFSYFNEHDISVTMKMGDELSLLTKNSPIPYELFQEIFNLKNKGE